MKNIFLWVLAIFFIFLTGNLFAENNQFENNPEKMTNILIFVSFSMPEQSLVAYLHDARKIHASVVIRGLIDHSFKKTFQKMAELVKASNGDGVELNPLWFKRFNINKVPAVVVAQPDQLNNFDVIYGDIPLAAALNEINQKGTYTQAIAQSALNQLRASDYV